jgi:hypothetical protein
MTMLAARALAGLVAVGILLCVAWAVLVTALIGGLSARAPDPCVPDGDPCCHHPDTWGEVAWGLTWTLGFVLLDALLAAIGIALLSWAIRQRWPRLKRLAMLPGGAMTAAVLLLALVVVPQLDEGGDDRRTCWDSGDLIVVFADGLGVATEGGATHRRS